MYAKYLKRILDILCSLPALLLCAPVLALIAILVRIKLGKPTFFRQQRVGRGERTFILYKFRTMTEERDSKGNLLPNEMRFTKLGSFLRSTSLDELPELFNVLKGDISLIGPRPLVKEYLPYYSESERKRHDVRGGLIPPELLYHDIMPSWERQFEYEVYYAQHVSFLLDLKITVAAVKGIIRRNEIRYGNYVRASLNVERAKANLNEAIPIAEESEAGGTEGRISDSGSIDSGASDRSLGDSETIDSDHVIVK